MKFFGFWFKIGQKSDFKNCLTHIFDDIKAVNYLEFKNVYEQSTDFFHSIKEAEFKHHLDCGGIWGVVTFVYNYFVQNPVSKLSSYPIRNNIPRKTPILI